MTFRFAQLALTAVLFSGILTSCSTFGSGNDRQSLLDHHLKLRALTDAAEQKSDQIVVSSKPHSTRSEPDVIMPLGDPQPLVDEIGLAPNGPSKIFTPDPVDEVGLFPED